MSEEGKANSMAQRINETLVDKDLALNQQAYAGLIRKNLSKPPRDALLAQPDCFPGLLNEAAVADLVRTEYIQKEERIKKSAMPTSAPRTNTTSQTEQTTFYRHAYPLISEVRYIGTGKEYTRDEHALIGQKFVQLMRNYEHETCMQIASGGTGENADVLMTDPPTTKAYVITTDASDDEGKTDLVMEPPSRVANVP